MMKICGFLAVLALVGAQTPSTSPVAENKEMCKSVVYNVQTLQQTNNCCHNRTVPSNGGAIEDLKLHIAVLATKLSVFENNNAAVKLLQETVAEMMVTNRQLKENDSVQRRELLIQGNVIRDLKKEVLKLINNPTSSVPTMITPRDETSPVTESCRTGTSSGPHTVQCLIKWWISSGCSVQGTSSPQRHPSTYWNSHTVDHVKRDMAKYFQRALNGESRRGQPYTKYCFGENLIGTCGSGSASGPHPMQCLVAWWIAAGCTLHGTVSPNRHPSTFWHSRSVSAVKADMAAYKRLANEGKSTNGVLYTKLCG